MYKDILKTKGGIAYIGKVKLTDLIKRYGTPLICYDQVMIENNLRMFKETFTSSLFDCEVVYASKAFSTLAMYQLLNKFELGADFVSGGEIFTALKAGFNLRKGYFHGNNKSEEELELAITNNIGCIVIDNDNEITLLEKLTKRYKKKVNVMIRLNPGIEAHTHSFIQTAKLNSKFGFSIFDEERVVTTLNRINNCKFLDFKGLHCHIGSQIFDANAHAKAAKVMIEFISALRQRHHIFIRWLNLGGGFGVSVSDKDKPYNINEMLVSLLNKVETYLKREHISLEKLTIEPGRSIVSECAATLYEIGGIKETLTKTSYLFINGGMSDNIRPALYDAKYECDIVSKIGMEKTTIRTIAGKNCESGDILIRDVALPNADIGDTLIVYSTGAYTYSMSSNYNRNPRPGVVFINNKNAQLIVKRETYEDVLNNDILLEEENEII